MIAIATEGIVLKTIRYDDTSEIITVLTRQLGIITIIYKPGKKSHYPPLFEGEFTLRKGKNFFYIVDVKQTFHHIEIRQSFDAIETAFKMIQYLLKTQLPLKAAPQLFGLFSGCLKKICHPGCSEKIEYLFLAKLLLHEGHLNENHPVLAPIAKIRSFQQIDTIEIGLEKKHLLTEIYNQIY